jgi:hypothetical protein
MTRNFRSDSSPLATENTLAGLVPNTGIESLSHSGNSLSQSR